LLNELRVIISMPTGCLAVNAPICIHEALIIWFVCAIKCVNAWPRGAHQKPWQHDALGRMSANGVISAKPYATQLPYKMATETTRPATVPIHLGTIPHPQEYWYRVVCSRQ